MNTRTVNPISARRPWRAFTILEMLVVLGIIGFLAAVSLPHLKGFTSGSTMTGATRQLLDDVALARQRAMANRAQVCIVFLPSTNWWGWTASPPSPITTNTATSNLYTHQYSAYAIISLRTVGDQPGRSNVHYLTDWQYLPQGICFESFQFITNNPNGTPALTNLVSTTNTTTGLTNIWSVASLPSDLYHPIPSTFSTVTAPLPYICFMPNGQLKIGYDQYIMLTRGSVLASAASQTVDFNETPPGNGFSNPNLIHIDWLTGRAKIEENQF